MSELKRPRVLIEDWLPTVELGIESRRERAAASALPPLSFLHVWWARRPLVASAGAVLGSLMPAWASELLAEFPEAPELENEDAYRQWFLRLCGILGDPVEARRRLDFANANDIKLKGNGYGYKQAYKNSPSSADIDLLQRLLRRTWGATPTVCDPTAGGGSIPYEAARYALPAIANDLNPVAAAVLRAGIAAPITHGAELAVDINRWGSRLCERVRERLEPYFALEAQDERVVAYIFARSIACPRTGKLLPLAPNWWLRRGSEPVAVRLVTERAGGQLDGPEFEIVEGKAIDFDPSDGTVARGDAISPWDGLAIDGDYIKAEAQAGRMGSILYAVAIHRFKGRGFRETRQGDLDALAAAESELRRLLPRWEAADVLPTESRYIGPADRSANYGIVDHRQLYSPRQLLVHGTYVEEFRRLIPEVRAELGEERSDLVLAQLALAQGTALNWNAILSSWNVLRAGMRSVFDRHDFSFKWTYAEFDGARALYQWAIAQSDEAYERIANLLKPSDAESFSNAAAGHSGRPPTILARNAADLIEIESASVELVCIDPPYYDNVMYAELADFFYVWEKRTLGLIHPDLFTTELTDKENEAVANQARFAEFGRRRKELANADYQAKMAAIFAECERVLRDDGVLTVMFTHKRAEAWDTLGTALMEAGFTIETSWPVNTESEHSLHQAKKNAAASTIMLVCRKREAKGDDRTHAYFEDLEGEVRQASREALQRFSSAGIEGVDLLLSTYGPALSIISSAWPVYSSEANEESGRSRLLRPEEALDAAREEVVRLQRRRLVGAEATLDPLSDFTLIAWDTFRAAEFPFDEARRLALAVGGLDVDELVRAKLVSKKSGTVELLPPAKRIRRGDDEALPGVRPGATSFSSAIDAVHTVMHVADTDGLPAAKALMDRAGLRRDAAFTACVQGLINSIPRTKEKGEWVRPEAGTLDRLCTAFLPDIEIPPDPLLERDFEQEELDLSGA